MLKLLLRGHFIGLKYVVTDRSVTRPTAGGSDGSLDGIMFGTPGWKMVSVPERSFVDCKEGVLQIGVLVILLNIVLVAGVMTGFPVDESGEFLDVTKNRLPGGVLHRLVVGKSEGLINGRMY